MRILICEDAGYVRQLLIDIFQEQGLFDVWECKSGSEVLPLVMNLRPNLIILDMALPGKNGWQVLQELREQKLDPISIWVLSSFAPEELGVTLIQDLPPQRWIKKPFQRGDIVNGLNDCFVDHDQAISNKSPRREVG